MRSGRVWSPAGSPHHLRQLLPLLPPEPVKVLRVRGWQAGPQPIATALEAVIPGRGVLYVAPRAAR